MTYNLTNATNATKISTFMVEINSVSNQWIFSSFLIMLYAISLITMKQLGFDYGVAFFSASVACTFLGAIMLFFGGIGVTLFSILLALSVFSLFVFALGGR